MIRIEGLITKFFLCCCFHPMFSQHNLFELLPVRETGIDFQNNIKETEELNVLSYEYFYNGGGVAAGDINNDGLIDLYFTGNMVPDKLYLNLGNFRFKDISKQAGIKSENAWKTGVTMVDINSDGLLDIYISYSGSGDSKSRKNKLFINKGKSSFSEEAHLYGIDDAGYSTQAVFFDYDRDGDLDMYLVNHNIQDNKEVENKYLKTEYDSLAGDKLYRNDNMHFADVTRESGISANPISFGLGVAVSDLNADGWPDIYVSNDYQENDYVYINQRDGSFKEMSHTMLDHISNFSMGNDLADFNNDGLPDILTLDMLPEENKRQKLLKDPENYELYKASVANGFHHQFMRNMLHLNNGDGTFSEIGQLAGISNTDWSWSSLLADFDNDGFKDLFVTNGYLRDYTNKDFLKYWGNYVVQKATKMEKAYLMDIVKAMPSTKNKNYIFKNNGDLTFSDKTNDWGFDKLVLSNGAAYADLDNDGDLEIIINNVNEPAAIYRNNSRESGLNNFVDLDVRKISGARAVGAKVELFAGERTQMLELNVTRGFQSSVSPVLHFGLGDLLVVDSLVVHWPLGARESFTNINVNQLNVVKEGDGMMRNPTLERSFLTPYFSVDTTKIVFQHRDYDYNDFKRQPLMPFMYSFTSPVLVKGDINNDGLDDLFIGTSKGQASKVYVQKNDGSFEEQLVNPRFYEDRFFTTTSAVFVDVDNDHDLDLYTTSGMYHDFEVGNALLNDRLYINDGTGYFSVRHYIENNASGKSSVAVIDFDGDGDNDLFVGGRVLPGRFPETPRSYLLQNDGKGNFVDVTEVVAKELEYIGMVTDVKSADLNHDKLLDLVVVGEYMPLSVFLSTGTGFRNATDEFFDRSYHGFWNTVALEDLDNDGNVELFVGNLGLNSQIHASETQPVELVYSDFDKNGSVDPFFCYFIQGKSYPDASRDMVLDQIYPMRKKFTSYESYSSATLTDMFTSEQLSVAQRRQVNDVETRFFMNINGRFVPRSLPVEAQFSPVTSFQFLDANSDGVKDVVLLGNLSTSRLKYGKMDANHGILLLNEHDHFRYIPQYRSGLKVRGDVKSAITIQVGKNKLMFAGVNRGKLVCYRLNETSYEN